MGLSRLIQSKETETGQNGFFLWQLLAFDIGLFPAKIVEEMGQWNDHGNCQSFPGFNRPLTHPDISMARARD